MSKARLSSRTTTINLHSNSRDNTSFQDNRNDSSRDSILREDASFSEEFNKKYEKFNKKPMPEKSSLLFSFRTKHLEKITFTDSDSCIDVVDKSGYSNWSKLYNNVFHKQFVKKHSGIMIDEVALRMKYILNKEDKENPIKRQFKENEIKVEKENYIPKVLNHFNDYDEDQMEIGPKVNLRSEQPNAYNRFKQRLVASRKSKKLITTKSIRSLKSVIDEVDPVTEGNEESISILRSIQRRKTIQDITNITQRAETEADSKKTIFNTHSKTNSKHLLLNIIEKGIDKVTDGSNINILSNQNSPKNVKITNPVLTTMSIKNKSHASTFVKMKTKNFSFIEQQILALDNTNKIKKYFSAGKEFY